MADWGDRLIGWITHAADEITSRFRIQGLRLDAMNRMRYSESISDLNAVYDALENDVRNDPNVQHVYVQRRAILMDVKKPLIEDINSFMLSFGPEIVSRFMPTAAISVAEAEARAKELLLYDIGKDAAFAGITFAAEVLSLGQVETAGKYFDWVRAKTGYGGATTMLFKAPIELGLMKPLSYSLHSKFRSTYISSQTAIALLTKDLISEGQARTAFAYEGYSEQLIDALMADRFRELRLGELAWAFNDADVDDAWLDRRLQYARYSPEDRPRILKMLKDKFMRGTRNRVAAQLRNLAKEGYISMQEFRIRLSKLEIPLQERDYYVQEAEALYKIDYNADLISTWILQYKNDIISEDVLRGNLSKIIADPARVEGQMQKAKAARRPVKVAEPKQATQGIRVSSKPSWSEIFLDGSSTGRLTPDTIPTPAGRHSVSIRYEGFVDADFDVNVQEGEYIEIHAPLEELGETI